MELFPLLGRQNVSLPDVWDKVFFFWAIHASIDFLVQKIKKIFFFLLKKKENLVDIFKTGRN